MLTLVVSTAHRQLRSSSLAGTAGLAEGVGDELPGAPADACGFGVPEAGDDEGFGLPAPLATAGVDPF